MITHNNRASLYAQAALRPSGAARCMVSFFEKNFWLLFREKRRCCAMIPAGVLGRARSPSPRVSADLKVWITSMYVSHTLPVIHTVPQAAIKLHWQKFNMMTALHLLTYLYSTSWEELPPTRSVLRNCVLQQKDQKMPCFQRCNSYFGSAAKPR